MPDVSPFARPVCRILHAAGGSPGARDLRLHVMRAGFGKHPAAIASHLTKLGWKQEVVTSYVSRDFGLTFLLTSDSREVAEEELKNANSNG